MTSAIQQPLTRSIHCGTADYDVAIIGAGPYGLSAAAHLKARGLAVALFGMPMEFWANRLPAGMLLRSPRFASSIADPSASLTLERYEASVGLPPQSPIPLSTFVNYGNWFHDQLGVFSHPSPVGVVMSEGSRFRINLQNGASLTSGRVIVAAGLRAFAKVPEVFAGLPPTHVSHCYHGFDLADHKHTRVTVVGAGQSAVETAALLQEAGAAVEVIARTSQLRWIGKSPWLRRLGPVSRALYSRYDVGPAAISRLVSWPKFVSRIPIPVRDAIRTRAVRSACAPWLAPRLAKVAMSTGRSVRSARLLGDEVELVLDDGTKRRTDRVLLGTGYRVDVSRYEFLSPDLVSRVRQLNGYPVLGNGLSSSVPGLHFVGAPAARSFGPLLYFVAGTEFASRQVGVYIYQNRVAAAT